MRLLITLALLTCTNQFLFAQDEPPADPEVLKPVTAKDKISYAIGLSIGRNLQRQGMKLDPQMIAMGIASILEDTEPLVTQAEIQAASAEYDADMAAEKKAEGENNQAAAEKFLAENLKKKGVKVTKSGVQYIVLQEGTGDIPTAEDTVSTHYRGKLISGKTFDESYKGAEPTETEQPVSFGVDKVIAGWTEALQMMKVGSKYRLFIPPALAYGENGPPGIGSNSLLIFDIELLDVK